MNDKNLALAPISNAERDMLRRRLGNLKAAAKKKGTTLDAWEESRETAAGRQHFELGCWLYHYRSRIYRQDGLADRIDCARRIFAAGFNSPRYEFFTAFDFSERQFDTIFEMGDAEQVIAGLRACLSDDPTGGIAAAFKANGWSTTDPLAAESSAQADLFELQAQ